MRGCRVCRPPLLGLRDPTSALGVCSEALSRETISELHGDVTVVIVAHRMSNLGVCDRMMVIESGWLSAFDTPDELRAKSDFYLQALKLSGITAE